MNNIPIKNVYVTCFGLAAYLCAVGNNSSILITVIIPLTIPNRIPFVTPDIPSVKIKYTIKAPRGSVKPDRVPHRNE